MDLAGLQRVRGSQWDEGNLGKNWERHGVLWLECEQVFFNQPLLVSDDLAHSSAEPRFLALGQTDAGRRLFMAFTLRDDFIRVISARDMNRREGKEYQHASQEEATEADPELPE